MRDTVEFAGAGSNVHVCVRNDDQLRLAIADPVKLSQVLQNLVMNGIQAMPHGGYMDVEAHITSFPPWEMARSARPACAHRRA
jgi:signal transduction histidine kinase